MLAAYFIVQTVFKSQFIVIEVAAQAVAGNGCRIGNPLAPGRIIDIIAVIEDVGPGQAVGAAEVVVQIVAIFGRQGRVILPFAVVIAAVVIGVFRPLRFQSNVVADVFAADAAVSNVEAIGPAVVFSDGIAFFIVVVVFRFAVENAETDGVAGVVEVRMGIRENVVLVGVRIAAEFPADIGLIACTAQVRFSQAEDADQAVGVRVTGTDGDRTGLLFGDVDFNDDVFRIALARQATVIVIASKIGIFPRIRITASRIVIPR